MKTEIWNGHLIQFVEALGYEPTELATNEDPIIDRLSLMDGRFILTKSHRVLYETDVYAPDDMDVVAYPNVAVEVPNYLESLGKDNAIKFMTAVNNGLMAMTRASFPACHPDDISELAERLADMTSFDSFIASHEISVCNSSDSKNDLGYVYFLKAENGLTKIGCTNDVKTRMRAIAAMSPERLLLVGTIKTLNKYRLESELHEKHADKREHGEWFSLSDEDLMAAKDKYNLDFSVSKAIYEKV